MTGQIFGHSNGGSRAPQPRWGGAISTSGQMNLTSGHDLTSGQIDLTSGHDSTSGQIDLTSDYDLTSGQIDLTSRQSDLTAGPRI